MTNKNSASERGSTMIVTTIILGGVLGLGAAYMSMQSNQQAEQQRLIQNKNELQMIGDSAIRQMAQYLEESVVQADCTTSLITPSATAHPSVKNKYDAAIKKFEFNICLPPKSGEELSRLFASEQMPDMATCLIYARAHLEGKNINCPKTVITLSGTVTRVTRKPQPDAPADPFKEQDGETIQVKGLVGLPASITGSTSYVAKGQQCIRDAQLFGSVYRYYSWYFNGGYGHSCVGSTTSSTDGASAPWCGDCAQWNGCKKTGTAPRFVLERTIQDLDLPQVCVDEKTTSKSPTDAYACGFSNFRPGKCDEDWDAAGCLCKPASAPSTGWKPADYRNSGVAFDWRKGSCVAPDAGYADRLRFGATTTSLNNLNQGAVSATMADPNNFDCYEWWLYGDEVCGCNFQTYPNWCFAHIAGVKKFKNGRCDAYKGGYKQVIGDKKSAFSFSGASDPRFTPVNDVICMQGFSTPTRDLQYKNHHYGCKGITERYMTITTTVLDPAAPYKGYKQIGVSKRPYKSCTVVPSSYKIPGNTNEIVNYNCKVQAIASKPGYWEFTRPATAKCQFSPCNGADLGGCVFDCVY